MPLESFHSLQEDWKLEIQHMFDDLRTKEKVKAGDGVGGMERDPAFLCLRWGRDPSPEPQSLGPCRAKGGFLAYEEKAPCTDILTSDTA